MSVISLNKVQNVLPEFIDTRLAPTAPTWLKWVLGGGIPFILQQADNIINQYTPTLKLLGLVNEHNQLDIEATKSFMNAAFSKQEKVDYLNFIFDKQDGDALIGIMEKYRDA